MTLLTCTMRKQIDEHELRTIWLQEARKEAKQYNPIREYVGRVYFERTKRLRRIGPRQGEPRKRRTMEVELMKNLSTGRCVQMKDLRTPGLDALAEEALANVYIPPDSNPGQEFLEYFRQL